MAQDISVFGLFYFGAALLLLDVSAKELKSKEFPDELWVKKSIAYSRWVWILWVLSLDQMFSMPDKYCYDPATSKICSNFVSPPSITLVATTQRVILDLTCAWLVSSTADAEHGTAFRVDLRLGLRICTDNLIDDQADIHSCATK